jgi:hypothetical protein
MLREMKVVSLLIHNYGEFIKEFLRLYENTMLVRSVGGTHVVYRALGEIFWKMLYKNLIK